MTCACQWLQRQAERREATRRTGVRKNGGMFAWRCGEMMCFMGTWCQSIPDEFWLISLEHWKSKHWLVSVDAYSSVWVGRHLVWTWPEVSLQATSHLNGSKWSWTHLEAKSLYWLHQKPLNLSQSGCLFSSADFSNTIKGFSHFLPHVFGSDSFDLLYINPFPKKQVL